MLFKKDNLSPSEIIKDHKEYIKSQGDFVSWQDFFEGGAGQTIIELISGSQAIETHHHLMSVRESSLQHAKLDASVTELAVNKGVYRPPAKGVLISIGFDCSKPAQVKKGDIIGTYRDYKIYSLDNKKLYKGRNGINATIGQIDEFETTVNFNGAFYTYDVEMNYSYVCDTFEDLSINNETIPAVHQQMNLYNKELKNSVIRMPYHNRIRFVFGDGIVGRETHMNDTIKYKCLTYSDDLVGDIKIDHIKLLDKNIFDKVIINIDRRATGYLSKDLLRRMALRSTVDGRWVQSEDYENGLLKEYGEYLDDVKVQDAYPSEEVWILPKIGDYTPHLVREIFYLIENKRTNAFKANMHYVDPGLRENFYDFTLEFEYHGYDPDDVIAEKIVILREFIEKKLFVKKLWLRSTDLAVELTKLLVDGKMYAITKEDLEVEQFKFVRNLTINYTRV